MACMLNIHGTCGATVTVMFHCCCQVKARGQSAPCAHVLRHELHCGEYV